MFLSKIYCSFLILKISLSIRYIQGSNNTDLSANQQANFQHEKIISNSTEHFSSKLNKTIMNENTAPVYRTPQFSETTEKIFLIKNGTVVKSAFIPFVLTGSGENDSDVGRLFHGQITSDITKNRNKAEDLMKHTENLSQENVVIKNGKKYRIVKFNKNTRNFNIYMANNTMQRRSFEILPKLSSIIPVKWRTKGQIEMDSEVLRFDNETDWSILTSSKKLKKNSSQNFKHISSSEKIQKLLNLFTIVKFDKGSCYADGVRGTCLHQTECEAKGGTFTTTCAGELGVCCYFERTCGEITKENCTYFVNEGFPDSSTEAPKVCTLTLEKSHPNIKQLRLDFLIFQLKEPINGTCIHDRLVISGQDISDTIPDICGTNTGQHIYINMEDSNGPYNLNVITVGEYFPRNFRIKVTQVEQQDLLLAPKNCLQYYAEPVGYVQTFNYKHNINFNIDEIHNGYFNNLNYAICIKKLKGFCSISYENEEKESIHPSFQLINVDEDGERLLPPKQAGAETFDCPDDYIIVNGIRLCGEKLNDATIELDYTKNYPVTDTSNGPFILSVKTDAVVSGRGFYLKYTQHPCIV